jgi:hypothetical protein
MSLTYEFREKMLNNLWDDQPDAEEKLDFITLARETEPPWTVYRTKYRSGSDLA